MIAIGFAQSFLGATLSGFTGEASFSATAGDVNGMQNFMLCIAAFGAALTVPRLIDRYTFGASSTHVGSLMVSQAVRTFVRMPGRR